MASLKSEIIVRGTNIFRVPGRLPARLQEFGNSCVSPAEECLRSFSGLPYTIFSRFMPVLEAIAESDASAIRFGLWIAVTVRAALQGAAVAEVGEVVILA